MKFSKASRFVEFAKSMSRVADDSEFCLSAVAPRQAAAGLVGRKTQRFRCCAGKGIEGVFAAGDVGGRHIPPVG